MGRRTETTEFLKECMSDALLELLKEKPIDKISLQDVSGKAGVGRVTFYRHFTAKAELIEYKLECLWKKWITNNDFKQDMTSDENSIWFFSFFYEQRELLLLLYKQDLLSVVYDFIIDLFYQSKSHSDENKYIISFLAYGFLGILTEWVKGNFKESTEEMLTLVSKFY